MNELPSQERAKSVEIVRVNRDRFSRQKDLVVVEEVYSISVNGITIASIACMPADLERLAVGFLFSIGMISSYAEIQKIFVKEGEHIIDVETTDKAKSSMIKGVKTITSGCGVGHASMESIFELFRSWKISSNLYVHVSEIKALMKKFQRSSTLFLLTGGVHSAALCEPSGLLFFMEDIGRHNAVDKVLGECLMKGITMRDKILLLTGRISSDILVKAALCEIPVIVSQSAPTYLATEIAKRSGMTLIGFARGERLNVYSHEERLIKG
ncbi:MAG: formate dehydrogenase accessory sulfurtransferase FdhD [Thermoproteota archaeon]